MSEEVLRKIDSRLHIMTKLLALDVVKGRPFQEQVKLLYGTGMTPSEIADCLSKTSNNVRVALHYLKKKEAKKNE